MKQFRRLLLGVLLLLGYGAIQAQAPNLQLTLSYNYTLGRYEVYALPDATQPNFFWGPSQISIVAPASLADTPFPVISVAAGAWLDNSQIYAPVIDPAHDFHGVGSLGAPVSFTSGMPQLIFHFTLPGGCTDGLRLFINGSDPDSSQPGMGGGDFSNTVFGIVLPTHPMGYEAYTGNYNNGGIVCNQPPTITQPPVTTPEDTPIPICPTIGDPNPGDVLTLSFCVPPVGPTNGVAVLGPGNCITYTPNLNYNGPDLVCIRVCDQAGLCATVDVPITVTPVNDPPVAVTDNYTMPEDGTPITLTPLALDSDVDGDPLSIVSINGVPLTPGTAQTIPVPNGTVNITAGGVITFTPNLNFNGTVTFPYVITDGTATATANEVITVTPLNDPPVAVTDNYTMPEDGTPITLTPLALDSDPDGNPLSIVSINGTPLTPGTAQTIPVPNGTVNITAGGVITFTPNPNFNGMVTFPYVITDGTVTATANEVITVTPVNDPPVAVTDNYTMPEDGTPITLTPLALDSDVDGDPLSIVSINGVPLTPGTAQTIPVPNGTVGITAGGVITFTPNANFNGTVTFPYVITDGTTTATANEVITVTPVNDPPIAVTDNYTMPEDGTPITLTPLALDSDPDGNPLSIVSINGTPLTPGTPQTIPVPNGTVNITAGGVITFTPNPNFNGPVTFPYVITDGTATATANQVITVTPVNDPPVAVTDNYTMPEDGTPITLTPLALDSDPDGNPLSIVSINGVPLTPGTAQTIPVPNGTVSITAGGVITFAPNANFNGTVTFPYVITDGTATATANEVITVTPVNDPPVAVTDNYTMPEDGTPITLTPLALDSDPDGNPLSIVSINGTPLTPGTPQTITVPNGTVNITAGGVITFTPNPNFNGPVTFPYVITDGTATATADQVITVTPVNDPPVAVTDNYTMPEDGTPITLTPLALDSDPDGNPLSIVSINGVPLTPGTAQTIPVPNGTVSITAGGVITFTPNANFNGTVTFPYVITDGTATATANEVITVTPVNDPPVAVTDNYTMPEDGAPIPLTPLALDSDPDGNPLSIVSINGTPLTPGTAQTITVPNGTVNITAGGVITFTPNPNFSGTVTFPYVITDGTATATANQVIDVIFDPIARLQIKVMLQGALYGTSNGLMRDDLRSGGHLPLTEPYTALGGTRFQQKGDGGGETTTTGVLALNAGTPNAIVDWVFVELRSAANPTLVLETRSALVQRDGDVVSASDGVSRLEFDGYVGQQLFVSVKHRNHMGAMIASAATMTNDGTVVDFSVATASGLYDKPGATNYDGAEMVTVPVGAGSIKALWAGNANADGKVKYQGTANDNSIILAQVISHPGNTSVTYNFNNGFGYYNGDINMDGKVKYQGTGNDPSFIFVNIIGLYSLNSLGLYNYDLMIEQLP